MAITGTGKTSIAPWGGMHQYVYAEDYSKAESTVVLAGATALRNRRRKQQEDERYREAARLALLRRRKRELLQAERERALEAKTPQNAPQTLRRLERIDSELQQIHDEMIALEIQATERKKKRRKRDKLAVLLLMN